MSAIDTLKRFGRAVALAMTLASVLAGVGCDQVAATVSDKWSSESAAPVSFSARVVGITDGDTLTVLDQQNLQHTIRLAEIDAPERGQPWGDRSRQALAGLVFGKTVSIQQTDTDRYGRTVARIFREGEDINRAMVSNGAAWAYREYLTDQTLIATEARARASRAGLWSQGDAQTVEPWNWRRGQRQPSVRIGDERGAQAAQPLIGPRSSAGEAGEAYSCGSKRYCRQMSSCAEAQFYLRQCRLDGIDGDGDGEACETLCRGG